MVKEKEFEVNDLDLIEEAYDRVDVLVKLLEKKGVLGKGEYDAKLAQALDGKEENSEEE